MPKLSTKFMMLRNAFIFAILALILFLAYLNSFTASWHLDDKPNILDNKGLHIHNLKPESLIRTFFTSPESSEIIQDRLYRPIPCMTFAINWYFGKDRVFGYHVVNILVHIITAYTLFLTIHNVLKTPNLRNQYQGKENLIAFLTTVLWAINPIQVQAVTYIVQRMASMAAMFYILSIYFYVKTRQSKYPPGRIFLLLGCAISFLLALGSKQNTATLPLAVILIEIICFQDLSLPARRRILWGGSIASGIIIVVLSLWLFVPDNSISFFEGYQNRPFSLYERLLTESRIVLFYLSLIFYPLPNRLSIEHDITLSTSLFDPWTTIPAILFHLVLIGIGLSQIKKRPLIALAILFFYLNHVIESTIIPLELIFEHRNYLPSLFLFLPVAAGFKKLLDIYQKKNRVFRSVLLYSSVLILLIIGGGTYIRNMAWATEKTLWEDAMYKAPNSHRPYHNLARAYYTKIGQYDKAIELYQKSLDLRTNNNFANPTALSNLALLYVQKKNYQKATELWQNALALLPDDEVIRHRYVIGLIEMKNWNAALDNLNQLMSRHPDYFDYNYLKGSVLLNQNQYDAALPYFERSLNLGGENQQALLGAGICNNLMGHYERAEAIFRRVLKHTPDDDLTLLWLVETNLSVDDQRDVERYLTKLLKIVPPEELLALLDSDTGKDFLPTASKVKIAKLIESSAIYRPIQVRSVGGRRY
jgi:tetratricopeptide (TPR) repeat protein